MKNVPTVPEGDGNIDVIPQPKVNAKYVYDFVLNNYTEEECASLRQLLPTICKKALFGKEVGEKCKTPHLQGYINLKTKKRMTELYNQYPAFERCSFRTARNEEALIKYCQKDGDVWTYGFPKPLEHYVLWNSWNTYLLDEIQQPSDRRRINWFWSATGKMGKTALTRYFVDKFNAQFCSGGKYTDVMNLIYHTDMEKCNCVIFTLPKQSGNKISYSALESVKDGLVSNMKSYKNGSKIFRPPHIIVFANFAPDYDQMMEDRWFVHQIDWMKVNIGILKNTV